MRRIGVVLAAATAAAALAACTTTEQTTTPEPTAKSFTIGFVNGGTTEFHNCLGKAIEAEVAAAGSKLIVLNSGQDSAKEKTNVESLIAQKVDALVVQSVNIEALKATVVEAAEAKIPLFLTSVLPAGGDTSGFVAAALTDVEQVGRLDAEWIAQDAAGKPVKVGLIVGAPGAASDLMEKGFKAALPANATVLETVQGMFNPGKAKTEAEKMIAANPDLDYVFVASEEMALAAQAAFASAGHPEVKVVANNGSPAGIQAIKDGKLAATVANSPDETGVNIVKAVIKSLNGEQVDKITKTQVILITKDNTDAAPKYCR